MGKFIALFGLAAVLVFGLVYAAEMSSTRDARAAHERRMLALEYQQQARWQREQQPYIDMMLVSAAYVAIIGMVGFSLAVFAGVGLRMYHWGKGQQRIALETLKSQERVLIAQAQYRHALPSTHYAPHVTYAPRITTTRNAGELPQPEEAEAREYVPTFADLLERGTVGKGHPLLLGYTEGAEVVGSWLDLYSTAVAGLSGTGKTTSQRFLAAQTALHGARFAVCDPHYGTGADSLGGTLLPLLGGCGLCDIADNDRAILETVRMIDDMGQRRMSGQDRDTTPIILWIDELTALLGHSTIGPQLSMLLEKIAQQYRKRYIYASCSGQIWTAARTTSELRDSFASVLAHRMKRNQARLLLPAEEAQQVERLPVGTALLWRTSGQVDTLRIPQTTGADVQRVAGLLTATQPTMQRLHPKPNSSQSEAVSMPPEQPDSSQSEVSNGAAYHAPQSESTLSAEAARVYGLFLDGKSLAEITYQLRGVKSNQGGKYQAALGEVQDLLRQAMQRQRRV